MSFLSFIFGDPTKKLLQELKKTVEIINALEPEIQVLSDNDLSRKTIEFKKKLIGGAKLDEILPSAFAVVREAAKRTLHQRHFDVQLIGGIVLHRGQIAEMYTGEGKTLTSTLAVYLNALEGKGVHIVTPNDYLARRDAVWMGQIYHFLGLSVGVIQSQMESFVYDPHFEEKKEIIEEIQAHKGDEGTEREEKRDNTASFKVNATYLRPVARKEAYAADIIYGTNNEYGFDYLRDNMAMSTEERVQRKLHYAIVDEIDSILVDEARTPLIISAPAEEPTELYYTYAKLIATLDSSTDYTIDEKARTSILTSDGIEKVEKVLGVTNLYTETSIRTIHHVENALRAHALFKKDKDYVVQGEDVIIVDEFTGRLMHGRRYSEGLHQAIEAKEGVVIQRESETLATITFQNYFRMYKKLAGMTGTAATEAEEFAKIYNLEVVTIPTNMPIARLDASDRVYRTMRGKYSAVIREIEERRAKGQPMLVGTASIEKNELLSSMLTEHGIPHELLNAKNHEREAAIIAQAGRPGAVTIATNMAGRGVDIVLGGNPPDAELSAKVCLAGGLCVIGTERHESRRIDNQLRGRSGRQGDPGFSQFYLSLEDDLMRIFSSDRMKSVMARLNFPEDMPIENGLVTKSIEQAQKRVESHNFDIRKHLLEYDDVLNRHRNAVYGKRARILELGDSYKSEDVKELELMIIEMMEREFERIVTLHFISPTDGNWNSESLIKTLESMLPLSNLLREKILKLKPNELGKEEQAKLMTEIVAIILEEAKNHLKAMSEKIGDVKEVAVVYKNVMLRAIDMLWLEHLVSIDHLRTSIGLQGYGQRDPLIEYKKQAFNLFNQLMDAVETEIVMTVFRAGGATIHAKSLMERAGVIMAGATKIAENIQSSQSVSNNRVKKVGRNELCPCGSGKKYKKCHGQ